MLSPASRCLLVVAVLTHRTQRQAALSGVCGGLMGASCAESRCKLQSMHSLYASHRHAGFRRTGQRPDLWLIEIAVLTIMNTNPPGRLVAAHRRRGCGSGGADAQVTAHTSIRVAEVAHPFIKDPPGRVVTARGGRRSRGGAEAQAGSQAAALLTTRRPVRGALPHRHRQRRLRQDESIESQATTRLYWTG